MSLSLLLQEQKEIAQMYIVFSIAEFVLFKHQ